MTTAHRLLTIALPLVIQSALIYGLNHVHSIHWCALFFSLFTLHILYIMDKSSLKTALSIHATSVLVNLLLNMNATYYIQGQPIQQLYMASYFSVLLSISLGLFLNLKLKARCSDASRFMLSSLFVSFVDGICMMLFFIPTFSMERIFHIFTREVSYKALYTFLILASLHGIRLGLAKMQASRKLTSLGD